MLRIIAIIFKAHLRRAVLANRNSGVGTDNLTPNPQTFAEQEKLGIDALALTDEPDRFAEMLRNRKVGIKAALVDQQFIAGLGNIYVDEILFRARISPRAKASELSDQGVRRLLSAMRQVLDLAIRHQAAPVRLPRSCCCAIGTGATNAPDAAVR